MVLESRLRLWWRFRFVHFEKSPQSSFQWRHKRDRDQDRPVHRFRLGYLEQHLFSRFFKRRTVEYYNGICSSVGRQSPGSRRVVFDCDLVSLQGFRVFALRQTRELYLWRQQLDGSRRSVQYRERHNHLLIALADPSHGYPQLFTLPLWSLLTLLSK